MGFYPEGMIIYPMLGRFYWRRQWHPTPVLLPGKPHGQKSLAGYSPWGCNELDMTEHVQEISLCPFPFNSPSHCPLPHRDNYCPKFHDYILILPVLGLHMNGIIKCLLFGVWLSLSMTPQFWASSILMGASVVSSLLLLCNSLLYKYTTV